MATETKCCTFTRGSFYLGEYQDPCSGLAPFGCPPPKATYRNIGNVESASISVDYEVFGSENKYHQHYDDCARAQVIDVTLDVLIGCSDNLNIQDFLFSQSANGMSGSKIEDFYCFNDGIIADCTTFKLEKTNVDVQTLIINLIDENGDPIRALVEGTEYEYKDRMVVLLQEINEPAASKVRFSYSYDDSALLLIDALKQNNTVKTIVFRGANYAEGEDSIVDVEIFKFRHGAADSFEIIQDGSFLNLRLQGTIERFYDGSSEECFFRIIKGE